MRVLNLLRCHSEMHLIDDKENNMYDFIFVKLLRLRFKA